MATLLIKNATLIVTMDGDDRELKDAAIFCRDGFIEQIGAQSELPQTADRVLDLQDHIILPGLINTHHHFYQTLTRALPACQDANLFNWLTALYLIWARMTLKTSTSAPKPRWQNSPSVAARPPRIISISSPMVPN